MEKREHAFSRLKITMIILAALLVISAAALAARYIYLHAAASANATVTIPYNLIGNGSMEVSGTAAASSALSSAAGEGVKTSADSYAPQASETDPRVRATELQLYRNHASDNEQFEAQNMLPGDTVTQYFCVRAYHDAAASLVFETEITDQTNNLGDVLRIKVTDLGSGTVLCDAPFSEVDGRAVSSLLQANADGESTVYYQVDVSMSTSVGNEYQASLLRADFNWYIDGEESLTPSPSTGEGRDIVLWSALAVSSLLLIILLLLGRRREGHRHG